MRQLHLSHDDDVRSYLRSCRYEHWFKRHCIYIARAVPDFDSLDRSKVERRVLEDALQEFHKCFDTKLAELRRCRGLEIYVGCGNPYGSAEESDGETDEEAEPNGDDTGNGVVGVAPAMEDVDARPDSDHKSGRESSSQPANLASTGSEVRHDEASSRGHATAGPPFAISNS